MIEALINLLDDDVYNIYNYLIFSYKKYIRYIVLKGSNIFIYTLPCTIQYMLKTLKYSYLTKSHILVDLFGTDYPFQTDRFKIIYNLSSHLNLIRFFCVIFVKPLTKVASVTNIYFSAGWSEREVWDMFGVVFFNNPDLRRILTDYGFKGFPLRKDFPVSGYYEIFYDAVDNIVKYEPIVLTQEMRFLNYNSGWESWDNND